MSHGKQFEKDLLLSLRNGGSWAERFRDNTFSGAKQVGSHASPTDIIVVHEGRPTLMELKAITCGHDGKGEARMLIKGAISVKRCDGHQRERLLDFQHNHGGKSFVAVMFYTLRAQRRCAVLIPIDYWVASPERYGRGTVRLSDLRRDLPAPHHLKWVGRKHPRGPYMSVRHLDADPTKDQT